MFYMCPLTSQSQSCMSRKKKEGFPRFMGKGAEVELVFSSYWQSTGKILPPPGSVVSHS
jgi:hypothetical protein